MQILVIKQRSWIYVPRATCHVLLAHLSDYVPVSTGDAVVSNALHVPALKYDLICTCSASVHSNMTLNNFITAIKRLCNVTLFRVKYFKGLENDTTFLSPCFWIYCFQFSQQTPAVIFPLFSFIINSENIPEYGPVWLVWQYIPVMAFYNIMLDRLCGLLVRVPGYRSGGPGRNSRRYRIFWVVGL
jgi:hypothetical protein